jgi:hypothetical protein
MAIALTLVERTPHRLRWLAVSDGVGGGLAQTALTNKPTGGTENTDLARAADAVKGQPIAQLVNTPVASDAAAQRVFSGDGLTSIASLSTARGEIKVVPRNSAVAAGGVYWSALAVDGASVDPASAGRPAILITGPNIVNLACYIELTFKHTYQR